MRGRFDGGFKNSDMEMNILKTSLQIDRNAYRTKINRGLTLTTSKVKNGSRAFITYLE